MDRETELKAFKRDIPLSAYAAAAGYVRDPKESSRRSEVMRHPNGDKVIIGRAQDGNWVYWSTRDESDNGSLIDFEQHRNGGTIGDVRKRLRGWLDGSISPPPPSSWVSDLQPTTRDLMQVEARLAGMLPISAGNAFLKQERGIPSEVLNAPRFTGLILIDHQHYDNVIFPHYNTDGVCGWEARNSGGFKGFAPGGTKGLFPSRITEDDRELVITEDAIDALSYAALKGVDTARFVSTAGAMNPDQPELLRAAMNKMPAGSHIVIATDADEGGDHLAAAIAALFDEVGRGDLTRLEDRPPRRGQDWNDILREREDLSPPPFEPGLA